MDAAPDLETHFRQLSAAVTGAYDTRSIRPAIERFLRPHGLDRRATAIMVDAIEAIGGPRRGRSGTGLAERAWLGVRTRLSVLRRHASEA